jgi:hypothetical protein
LRRVILAFAVRTASDLVDFCFCCGAFVTFPIVRVIICAGMIEARSIGCVLIGPVGLFWSMVDNSLLPDLFKGQENLFNGQEKPAGLSRRARVSCGPEPAPSLSGELLLVTDCSQ